MTQAIRCIVGLGNPGSKYESTRHNAGFWFVDELARRHNVTLRNDSKFFGEAARITLQGHDCWLLKPGTFMNRSGQSVSALAKFYKIDISETLVVHDELDLPPGTVRLKQGGGHGGHNGLRDIISAMGGNNFHRLRIGIGHPGHRNEVVDFVLHAPGKEEFTEISRAIDRAADHIEQIIQGEHQKAMNSLHS